MLKTYEYPEFEYSQTEEQKTGQVRRRPVIIIGAGPVGLTMALDCAARGIHAAVFDDNNTVSIGSRAVCYAKRPLEIWDRLGCAGRMVEKGVDWKVGKVFFGDDLRYSFDLLPAKNHKMPAMINLQQYYLEEYLVDACLAQTDLIDLHFKHKLIGLKQREDHVVVTLETPDGVFQTECDWLIACDGANSDIREMVGAEFVGQFFQAEYDGLLGIGSPVGVPRLDWGHSCVEDVMQMAQDCEIKSTYIGHHDPNRDWSERNWIDQALARKSDQTGLAFELARAETVIDL